MPGSGLRRIVPEENTLFELAFVGKLFIQEQRRSYNQLSQVEEQVEIGQHYTCVYGTDYSLKIQ